MINPAEIPQIPGDMAALGRHAAALTGLGTAFPETGRRVHSTWQTLAPVYSAPESGQLFAATGPVQTVTASVGQDFTVVGGALSAYADEVAAIKARLEALRTQASEFVDTVGATEDWRENEDDVNRHNQMLSDVNAAVADFQDAQRRCANAILGLYSDRRFVADNGDGVLTEGEYGFTREMFDAALAEEGGLPWGAAEEHDRGFLGDVGAFFVGIKDGAVDMVTGLGALIGYADGEWSWATAGAAWKGLGTFALALSPVALTLNSFMDLPGLPRGTLQDTLLNAGKALIAYDTWGEDKSKAAGMVTFNVVSAVLGTKGAGAALRGGGTAAQASRFGLVAKAGGGMVRAGEFLGRMPTVGELASRITTRLPGFHVPHIDIPNVDVPPTHVDVPNVDAPRAEVPSGSPSIGDAVGDGGRNALPPSATITPHGVVDGRVFDPPTPSTPDGPPLVQDGVIGGGRGVDTPGTPDTPGADAPPRPDTPSPAPSIGDAVGDGARGLDAPDTPGAAGADAPPRPEAPNPADGPSGLGDAVGDGARDVAPPGGVIDQRIVDPPGADAPPRVDTPDVPGERALPPGATLRPEGVVDGRIFDPPNAADRPPLVQDGVIGGGRGGQAPDVPGAQAADAAPPPRPQGTEVPARVGADAPIEARAPERPVVPDRLPDRPLGPGGLLDGRAGFDGPDAPAPRPDPDLPGGRHEADPPVRPDADATPPGGGDGPGGDGPGGDGPGDGPDGDGDYGDDSYYGDRDGTPDGGDPAGEGVPGPAGTLPPGVHPPLVRDELLPPKELETAYRYENDPSHPNAAFGGRVEYFTPEVLEAHRVVVIDGKLHWAHDGSPLDTSNASTVHSAGQPRAMFVMDRNGNLYVSPEQIVGQLHHSSFLGGGPVAGAGEISVVNGVPQIMSRKSGHYRPLPEHQRTVADVLREQGLDTSGINFEMDF
ncbi:hypothetical protein [Pseudonocardia lacus]|uniref:hypothetical protein n=1 Tax=Pseudonocardia lacus TaxID=2835865 RepID=UPI001BDC3CDB|nr:hypothetical protein [Pseudonocardia lacus]